MSHSHRIKSDSVFFFLLSSLIFNFRFESNFVILYELLYIYWTFRWCHSVQWTLFGLVKNYKLLWTYLPRSYFRQPKMKHELNSIHSFIYRRLTFWTFFETKCTRYICICMFNMPWPISLRFLLYQNLHIPFRRYIFQILLSFREKHFSNFYGTQR